ncbi:MAG: putative glycolipid-binding domain-containing protein [Pseudomonadota bacterium]
MSPEPTAPISTVYWRRMDVSGQEACRMTRTPDGWRLDGAAVFREADNLQCMSYRIDCDADWLTRQARVSGWVGARDLSLRIAHQDGVWTVNGTEVAGLHTALDIDLGFTPSTNTLVIRRSRLRPGQSVDVTAAWLDTETWTLKPLDQTYTCTARNRIHYASPGFQTDLKTDSNGWVTDYPGIWSVVR